MREMTIIDELPELAGWMTISLAAEKLGVSRQAAHKMVKSGRLMAWRVPSAGEDRPLVVRDIDVEKMVKQRQEVVTVLSPVAAVMGGDAGVGKPAA